MTTAVVAAIIAIAAVIGIWTAVFNRSAAPNPAPGIDQLTSTLLNLEVLPTKENFIAPNIHLIDQAGNAVSLRQFHGRSVLITFNDDKCTDLCTLLAQDLLRTQKDLGHSARYVTYLSVNANPFYPSVSAVRTWTDQHQLNTLHNWYFGTSSPKALRTVWRSYGVTVLENRRTRSVMHSTEMFFVDPKGKIGAIGSFGASSADTAFFAHATAQMMVDLLPSSTQGPVGGPSTPPPSAGNITPGAPAPAFQVPRLTERASASAVQSRTVSLASLRGKPTVITFWSTSCVACRSELPQLQAADRRLAGKVHFLAIDVGDRASAAEEFARSAGLTYPLASDRSGLVASTYGVAQTPYSIIVGPRGTIETLHPGVFTTEQVIYVLETQWPNLTPGGSS